MEAVPTLVLGLQQRPVGAFSAPVLTEIPLQLAARRVFREVGIVEVLIDIVPVRCAVSLATATDRAQGRCVSFFLGGGFDMSSTLESRGRAGEAGGNMVKRWSC